MAHLEIHRNANLWYALSSFQFIKCKNAQKAKNAINSPGCCGFIQAGQNDWLWIIIKLVFLSKKKKIKIIVWDLNYGESEPHNRCRLNMHAKIDCIKTVFPIKYAIEAQTAFFYVKGFDFNEQCLGLTSWSLAMGVLIRVYIDIEVVAFWWLIADIFFKIRKKKHRVRFN